MSEAVAQYIEDSLESLRKDGWTTDQLVDEKGARCAMGALYDTQREFFFASVTPRSVLSIDGPRAKGNMEIINAATKALMKAIPVDGETCIATYNNSRTDFAEIEVWFKQAAANERESE